MRKLLLLLMLCLMELGCELYRLDLQYQLIQVSEQRHLKYTSEIVLNMDWNDINHWQIGGDRYAEK